MIQRPNRADFDLNDGRLTATANASSLPLVARVTRQTLNRAKVLTPVRTGKLRASLSMSVTVTSIGPVGRVTTNVSYAQFVHDGTRAHVIRAKKRGGVLRFEVGGRVLYRPVVRHPGTRARPFLRRAHIEVAAANGFSYG